MTMISTSTATGTPQLKRTLGLFSATMLVSGVMIGSGIFIVPADIARQLGSPGLLLGIWLFTAVVTLFGAMSYGKLAVAYPEAGGQYVFLRKAWGDIPAFLYGWALFFVIQTGTLAAVAMAFSMYLGVWVPAVSSKVLILQTPFLTISTQQLVAMGLLGILTAYNCLGIKKGAVMQNIFTVLKVVAVVGLIAVGFMVKPIDWNDMLQSTYQPLTPSGLSLFSAFAVATVGALFSADAWNNVTFIGSEIQRPERNLPKAMVLGTLLVLVLYILTNIGYLNILPFSALQHAPEDRVAAAAMSQLMGPTGAMVMAGIILVSTFGCLNGLVLAGARVFYAMAGDGMFFRSFARVHPKWHTPVISLMGQGLCAMALTLSGSYSQLLDYAIFTTLLFYFLTVCGLFRLARQNPEAIPMPNALSYVIPIVYLILITYVAVNLALFKQQYTLPGLAIVALGLPIYALWKRFYMPQGVSAS